MAWKLAYAMGGEKGSALLDYISKNCAYLSVRSVANKSKGTISRKDRIKNLYGHYLRIGAQSIELSEVTPLELEELMIKAFEAKDKPAIKILDAYLYALNLETSDKV